MKTWLFIKPPSVWYLVALLLLMYQRPEYEHGCHTAGDLSVCEFSSHSSIPSGKCQAWHDGQNIDIDPYRLSQHIQTFFWF